MNAKTLPISLDRAIRTDSKRTLSPAGVWTIIETIISTALALFAALFFFWINGRQQEFNELEDK